MTQLRMHVFVEGKVQGVSFRSHTRKIALNNYITGWIKNLSDGRVEAVLEGNEENLKKVIAWCLRGPERAVVQNVVVIKEPFQDEFNEFLIVFSEPGAAGDFQQPSTDSIKHRSILIHERV
jgi:acylphosphatase